MEESGPKEEENASEEEESGVGNLYRGVRIRRRRESTLGSGFSDDDYRRVRILRRRTNALQSGLSSDGSEVGVDWPTVTG